eukprot:2971632-Amphidinium_carterae.1
METDETMNESCSQHRTPAPSLGLRKSQSISQTFLNVAAKHLARGRHSQGKPSDVLACLRR